MKNPDLAWKFISYCISDREKMTAGGETLTIEGLDYFTGDLYTQRIPINKKNFVHQMDFLRTDGRAYTGSYYSGYEQKYIDPEICAKKLDEFLGMPLVNSKTHVIPMNDYLSEFYDNKLTTPEQCAEKIQGRAYIWLNE